jgi:hypothetical protein
MFRQGTACFFRQSGFLARTSWDGALIGEFPANSSIANRGWARGQVFGVLEPESPLTH